MHINREIMSFNLSLIFVYGMCIFSIHVNGIPLPDIIQLDQSIDTADLPSTDQISEILYQATTSNDFSTSEEKNEEKSLCESLLTTLTTSQGTDAIILAVARVQYLIRNLNHDTQQTIISNIFTTLDSCLKDQIPDHDFHSFRENLRNMIENKSKFPNRSGIIWKMPLDSNPDGNSDVSLNFDNDVPNDAHLGAFEEIHLTSEHENVPREVFVDPEDEEYINDYSQKEKDKRNDSGKDDIGFVPTGGNFEILRGFATPRGRGRLGDIGRKIFLFNSGMPRPPIDEGLSRKIFLFGNSRPDNFSVV